MANLTPEQQAVACHQVGHAKVIAVAGAGKTTTLVHFICQRLIARCDPRRLLVLMYNKSAQTDFQIKLQHQMQCQGIHLGLPDVRTFHSLGLKIYQRLVQQGHLPGYQDKLISSGEMDGIVWRLLQQVADENTRQDILSQRKKWVEPAVSFIELVKSDLIGPEAIFELSELPSQCRIFIECFYRFEEWRKQHHRISFSDMIYDPCCLFQREPEIARQFSAHMQWILVDEYQDVNAIQQFLLQILHGDAGYRGQGNVMVIGDADQTIYEFRGSRPEFIVSEFEKSFNNNQIEHPAACHHYTLPHTFRYGHKLSLLANHIISENKEREDVLCLSHTTTPNTEIHLRHCQDYSKETLLMLDQLAEQHPLEDIAILNRLWGISAPIELALLQRNIPYQLDHSQTVLDRWELEVFWILFEIAADRFKLRNRKERRQAWLILLTQPFPKIKRAILEQMAERISDAESDLSQAWWDAIPEDMSKWQKQQLEARAQIIEAAEQAAANPESKRNIFAYQMVNQFIDATDLYEGLQESAFSAQQIEDRQQTIKAFVSFLRGSKVKLAACHEYLMALKENHKNKERTGVRLTSIHKAKGLEWPIVIIPALSSRYYPYEPEGTFTSASSEESERRLLYVAMTRAKQALYLIAPLTWQQQAKQKVKKQQTQDWPSKFLRELCFDFCEHAGEALFGAGQEPDVLSGALTGEESETPSSKKTTIVIQSEIKEKSQRLIDRYSRENALPLTFDVEAKPDDNKKSARNPSESATGIEESKQPYVPMNNHHRFIDTSLEYEQGQWIKHGKLGRGQVLREDKQYLTVIFEGENKERTLNKEIAAPWLEDA